MTPPRKYYVGPDEVTAEAFREHQLRGCPAPNAAGAIPSAAASAHHPGFGKMRRTLPCVRLGPATGEVRRCESCAGAVYLKLMACEVHGVCTAARPVGGVAFCPACEDYDDGGSEVSDV